MDAKTGKTIAGWVAFISLVPIIVLSVMLPGATYAELAREWGVLGMAANTITTVAYICLLLGFFMWIVFWLVCWSETQEPRGPEDRAAREEPSLEEQRFAAEQATSNWAELSQERTQQEKSRKLSEEWSKPLAAPEAPKQATPPAMGNGDRWSEYGSTLVGMLIAVLIATAIADGVLLGFAWFLLHPKDFSVLIEWFGGVPMLVLMTFIIVAVFSIPTTYNMLMGRLSFDTSPHRSRYVDAATKRYVYQRDGGMCRQCFSTADLQYDHIVPFSQGSSHTASNIRLLCRRCNQRRGNRGGGWF